MENTQFRRTFGAILAGLGIILLLFACASFLSENGTVMHYDVSGWKKAAPTLLGIIFFGAGVSMINRA
jgi:hypothetical protein